MPLCDLSCLTFVQYFGGLYEQSPWVVERAYNAGLTPEHDDPEQLARLFQLSINEASEAERLALICAQPELFGKQASAGLLSKEASVEQDSAGLDDCTPEQLERFNQLNWFYWARFGFPFVMAVRGRSRTDIVNAYDTRLRNDRDTEIAIALTEIQKIAEMRLDALLQDNGVYRGTGVAANGSSAVPDDHVKGLDGMTPAQMSDPDYFPGMVRGLPLGMQHVVAMLVSNVTPAIIIAGAVGFGFGSADTSDMVYLIQMSMLFAGVATLIQTVAIGPIGARLPIVQGTSFAFVPVMIPIATVYGMATLMGAIVISGVFHFFLGTIIGRLRGWLPPLVTGLVVLMIGLAMVKVGIQYAAGGVLLVGQPEYGSLTHWLLALMVIGVTLFLKFFARGILSLSAVLIGLIAGYSMAYWWGMVDLDGVDQAVWFSVPNPWHFGFEINSAAIVAMCLMGLVLAIKTVGDVSGTTKGGAGRQATAREIAGATMANGMGNAISGVFGALPNTSYSQNVGLISMTGLMSRHVVTLSALVLIICGLVPKVGAAIQAMPIAVFGGGVIVMFGMVTAVGVNMLADVDWNRRNMMIFGISLSIGLGLQVDPDALQHIPDTAKVLMTSGLLPAALTAIVLDILLPDRVADDESKNKVAA